MRLKRHLRHGLAAIAALATLVVPASWPLHALGGPAGRTIPVSVCSSLGGVVPSELPLTDRSPSDRSPAGSCQQCPLCVSGADRPLVGPLPAGIPVPATAAESERPSLQRPAGHAPQRVRIARARDPPSLA